MRWLCLGEWYFGAIVGLYVHFNDVNLHSLLDGVHEFSSNLELY